MMVLEKVSLTGELVVTFNQPMILPALIKDLNYTELIDISFVSAKSGRIV
jgi:hypothetical protein